MSKHLSALWEMLKIFVLYSSILLSWGRKTAFLITLGSVSLVWLHWSSFTKWSHVVPWQKEKKNPLFFQGFFCLLVSHKFTPLTSEFELFLTNVQLYNLGECPSFSRKCITSIKEIEFFLRICTPPPAPYFFLTYNYSSKSPMDMDQVWKQWHQCISSKCYFKYISLLC